MTLCEPEFPSHFQLMNALKTSTTPENEHRLPKSMA